MADCFFGDLASSIQGTKDEVDQKVADLTTHVDGELGDLKQAVADMAAAIEAISKQVLPKPVPCQGVDMFGGNSDAVTNAAFVNPNYKFVIHKATEGLGFNDAKYSVRRPLAKSAQKKWGGYHFAWPNQDALKEAQHYVTVAGLMSGDFACLDLEDWGELDPTKPNFARDKAMRDATTWPMRVAYALAWLAEVNRLTGAVPFVYVNWTWLKNLRTAATAAQWAELISYPLWLADYSGVPGKFSSVSPQVPGGPTWDVSLHQWTNADNNLDGDWTPDFNLLNLYSRP